MPFHLSPRPLLALAVLAVLAAACALQAHAAGGWQANELNLPAAWQVTQGSSNVVVAIVDSGVQAEHPALQGRVLTGYDFVNHDANAADDNGHGTALAGIVAATCPRCSILPVKVLDGNRIGAWGTIAAGIAWAADHGAQVINLSVGATRAPDSLAAAVAAAVSKGVIVVTAAGNDGRNEPFYPALYPGVVSVAGVDMNRARYDWSNFGSWVTVAAPGCTTSSWIGGGMTSDFCGTSTAAPFVAGVAGLARAFRPTLTPAAFAAALRTSSAPLPDAGTAGGAVDANGLLLALGAPSAAPVLSGRPTVSATPRVGHRLVALSGRWSKGVSTTVQWQRSHGGGAWRPVARGAGYTPSRSDLHYRLRVVVTAANVRGVTTTTSAATPPVSAR